MGESSNKFFVRCFLVHIFKTLANVLPTVGQSFKRYKTVFRLNKQTNELLKTDEVVDINALIESCRDTALSTVLDRLLPDDDSGEVVQNNLLMDKLDIVAEADKLKSELRDSYKIPETVSDDKISDYILSLKSKLDEKIEKGEFNNDDEKKIIEKSEQA